jgi:hypothetical protein
MIDHTNANGLAILMASALALAACGGDGDGWSAKKIAACDAVISELAMPFDYEASPTEVRIQGLDGGAMHLVFGPWGAHNGPHTGHAPGNGKADMMAVLANGPAEMTSLDGEDCDAYDENNPNCGLPLAAVLDGRPYYVLPSAFSAETLEKMDEHGLGYSITSVYVKRKGVPGSDEWYYFDSPDQWEVTAEICGYYFMYGHVGRISPELQQALVERGVSVDFDDYDGEMDVNLVDGDPIGLAPGTKVAYPQLVGKPVPAGGEQTTAYARPHEGTSLLWSQIEFETIRSELDGSDVAHIARAYDLLDSTEYALWESILHLEMDDPNSARYGNPLAQSREWLWRAEGILNHTPEFTPASTENGLLRRLGDWWESYEGCGVADTRCDEVISFNRIDRDSPAFDESFYEAGSRYIIWWLRTDETPFDGYYGEILSTDGDLLTDSSGQFLVRWRNFDGGDPIDGALGTNAHQYLAWRLGDDDTLKIAWGASAADQGAATTVAVPAADAACDGKDVTCHTGFNQNVRPENIDGQL